MIPQGQPRGARPVRVRVQKEAVEVMMGDQVVSRHQVANWLGISVTTLWRMVKRRDFPGPFRISPGRVGWRARTVWQWLADRSGDES